MHSKNLRAVEGQGELPLVRAPKQPPVPLEVILAKRTFTQALTLAVQVSELEEKEIYIPLKIDAGHWTNIMKGKGHFPVDKLNDFCDLVGNEIALIWWAYSRGKGLHLLETEAERLLRVEREDHARTRERLDYLEDLHTRARTVAVPASGGQR